MPEYNFEIDHDGSLLDNHVHIYIYIYISTCAVEPASLNNLRINEPLHGEFKISEAMIVIKSSSNELGNVSAINGYSRDQ